MNPASAPADGSTPRVPVSVLVLSFTDLGSDPRVHRQIVALSGRYRLSAAGTAPPAVEGVSYHRIPAEPRTFPAKALGALRLKLRRYERHYWSQTQVRWCLAELAGLRPDVIIANDLAALPLALRLKPSRGVILDAHEYAPREHDDRLIWRVFFQDYSDYLCRAYLPQASGMFTVCESIAEDYRARYGVECGVLTNAPPYHDLEPRPTGPDRIRLVHHGIVNPSRGLELMIGMMDHLDERFHLDLFLVPNPSRYYASVVSAAARHPRVRVLPPVPMRELPRRLNEYDIGVYLLPPAGYSYAHALPNKLFEFIQARLAVAIGPSLEMSRVVRRHDCGIVAGDFDPRSLARELNALDPRRIAHFKQRSHAAARELCFEKNAQSLVAMVERVGAGG